MEVEKHYIECEDFEEALGFFYMPSCLAHAWDIHIEGFARLRKEAAKHAMYSEHQHEQRRAKKLERRARELRKQKVLGEIQRKRHPETHGGQIVKADLKANEADAEDIACTK
jgi:hypothetical protein